MRNHAPIQRGKVFAFVATQKQNGATRDEIVDSLGMSPNSVCPRVLELIKQGQIVETDRTRLTRAGRKAAVLVASKYAEVLR